MFPKDLSDVYHRLERIPGHGRRWSPVSSFPLFCGATYYIRPRMDTDFRKAGDFFIGFISLHVRSLGVGNPTVLLNHDQCVFPQLFFFSFSETDSTAFGNFLSVALQIDTPHFVSFDFVISRSGSESLFLFNWLYAFLCLHLHLQLASR